MLERSDSWERYVKLLKSVGPHIKKEFYVYDYIIGASKEVIPATPWIGKKLKGTNLRQYYTGDTFCVIEDKWGNTFIGKTVCSASETAFRKQSGRNEAEKNALEAMYRVYAVCDPPSGIPIHNFTLPEGIQHMTVRIKYAPDKKKQDITVAGMAYVPPPVKRLSKRELRELHNPQPPVEEETNGSGST